MITPSCQPRLTIENRLTDEQWGRVAFLFPHDSARRFGRPRRHPREVLNAVLWVLENRQKWHRLPATYPPAKTCYIKCLQWRREGILQRAMTILGIEVDCDSGFWH